MNVSPCVNNNGSISMVIDSEGTGKASKMLPEGCIGSKLFKRN